jgi:hypothetical protein
MSEPPLGPPAGTEPKVGDEREPAPGAPRWVKVVGWGVAALVVLMFVLLHLSGAVGPNAH